MGEGGAGYAVRVRVSGEVYEGRDGKVLGRAEEVKVRVRVRVRVKVSTGRAEEVKVRVGLVKVSTRAGRRGQG